MSLLFAQLFPRIKGRAVKTDKTWTQQPAVFGRVATFHFQRHVVESTKSDRAWNKWVKSARPQTVHLLVYEYGIAITKAQYLQEFKETCVTPPVTDRSGAAAEVTLEDMARQLQQHWTDMYQASSVVWRMWANYIARNLNRSTWEADVLLSPSDYILPMLNAANTRLEQHLSNLNRSASMALDVA
ncbi:hypothetical protein PHMEG_00019670 [Phytophthora megakarya]|uniref:Uncharacterized protein n=1 Tax=Phytophthora megakarya TaxID=4795 RepID=A0A225VRC9_9STRA|nr:hypothetical protein PHMEG_00019670 [Phytophthora megakarya]